VRKEGSPPPLNYSAGLKKNDRWAVTQRRRRYSLAKLNFNRQQALVYNRHNGQYLRTKSQVELTAFVLE
jgi:hypothetical protein